MSGRAAVGDVVQEAVDMSYIAGRAQCLKWPASLDAKRWIRGDGETTASPEVRRGVQDWVMRNAGETGMNLEKEQAIIAPELDRVETLIRTRLQRICKDDTVLDEAFHTFFRGHGKMLRPRLVLLSAFALREEALRDPAQKARHEALIALATVAELVHSASLLHDDVLDAASTRRGHPSLNARFGNKMAILAGDILYSQAFELLTETFSSEITLMLTRCVFQMCRAEVSNLVDHDFETYKAIIEAKTASLMMFCCRAGAEVVRRADDPPESIQALERFGHCFGMVYQLTDDLADGDSAVAVANRERVAGLLAHYTDGAQTALNAIANSAYKSNLSMLLAYVVAGTEKMLEGA